MQFVVTAYDGTDEKALERRLAVRESHLAFAEKLYNEKKLLYAGAILDDKGKMIGSALFMEFESKEALQKQWLDNEPYVTGNVWQNIKIEPFKAAGFCGK